MAAATRRQHSSKKVLAKATLARGKRLKNGLTPDQELQFILRQMTPEAREILARLLKGLLSL